MSAYLSRTFSPSRYLHEYCALVRHLQQVRPGLPAGSPGRDTGATKTKGCIRHSQLTSAPYLIFELVSTYALERAKPEIFFL